MYLNKKLIVNELKFFDSIFGRNYGDLFDGKQSLDVLNKEEKAKFFSFYESKEPYFSAKKSDKHFLFLNISKLLKNKKFSSIDLLFNENFKYQIKLSSFVFNKALLNVNYKTPNRDDLIRDKLIIIGEKIKDGENSRTSEFVKNMKFVFEEMSSTSHNDGRKQLFGKLFPKTDLFYFYLENLNESAPIFNVKEFFQIDDNKISFNELIPAYFKTDVNKMSNTSWMVQSTEYNVSDGVLGDRPKKYLPPDNLIVYNVNGIYVSSKINEKNEKEIGRVEEHFNYILFIIIIASGIVSLTPAFFINILKFN